MGGCCPPMDLFMSEPMQLVQIIIPIESAHLTVSYLGDLDLLQFKDGNLSHVSSTSILGSNHAYNSRSQGKSASDGHIHFPSTPILPQRPDQPECRYFMNTGTCKYGAEGKYHHPKERVAESAANLLGLPSRLGQPMCSNYIMYGICKYGPGNASSST